MVRLLDMRVPDSLVRRWISLASIPQERMASGYKLKGKSPDHDSLLARWRQNLAGGDEQTFVRALGWQGITREHAETLLFEHEYDDRSPLPPWATSLKATLEAASFYPVPALWEGAPDPNLIPFQEVWVPLVASARHALTERCEDNPFATDEILRSLEYDLLSIVGSVSSRTLYAAFSAFRITRRAGASGSPFSTELRSAFRDSLFEDGLCALFTDAPVLARIIGTLIFQWLDHGYEFLTRLKEDSDVLGAWCTTPFSPASVRVRTGISDRHNGGRRCIEVRLAGTTIIYKPRSLAPEKLFRELTQSFLAPQLRPMFSPRVLSREGYGWEEYVTEVSCGNEGEVRDYFRRAGAMMVLTYLLGGVDFHGENVIAHESSPVLIDLEGLFSHFPFERPSIESVNLSPATQGCFAESVLRTALLPTKMQIGDRLFDVAGFPSQYDGEYTEPRTRWRHGNTDGISPERIDVKVGAPRNRVKLCGTILLDPSQYLSEIKEGFSLQYEHLSNDCHRLELISWIQSQPEIYSRFIIRDTSFYAALNEHLLSSQTMRSGSELGILLDSLGRAYAIAFKEYPQDWKIVESEKQQLLHLDVPLFFSPHSTPNLHDKNGSVLPDAFAESALTQFQRRIEKLSDSDRTRQLQIIDVSYRSGVPQSPQVQSQPSSPLTSNQLLERAIACATILRQSMITDDSGHSNWLGLATDRRNRRQNIQPLSIGIYEGNLGPAIFFATIAKELCDSALKEFSLSVLSNAYAIAQNELSSRALIRDGLGAFHGMGSLVYAHHLCARILGEASLYGRGVELARRVRERHILEHESIDLVSGVSGLAIVLSLIAQRGESSKLEEQLLACRSRLLAVEVPSLLSSSTSESLSSPGLAHGSTGVLLACIRLGELLSDDALIAHAQSILDWEESLFSHEKNNWRAPFTDSDALLSRWCSGAPGIAISRLSLHEMGISRTDFSSLLVGEFEPYQSLCCGEGGVGDIYSTIGKRLDSTEIALRGSRLAAQALHRLDPLQIGKYSETVPDVGFFQGLSGLGYLALRQRNPELPWILGVE